MKTILASFLLTVLSGTAVLAAKTAPADKTIVSGQKTVSLSKDPPSKCVDGLHYVCVNGVCFYEPC